MRHLNCAPFSRTPSFTGSSTRTRGFTLTLSHALSVALALSCALFLSDATAFTGFAAWSQRTTGATLGLLESFESWSGGVPVGWTTPPFDDGPTESSTSVTHGAKSARFLVQAGADTATRKSFDLSGATKLRFDIAGCTGTQINLDVTGGCSSYYGNGTNQQLNITSCAGPNKTITIRISYNGTNSGDLCYFDNLRSE